MVEFTHVLGRMLRRWALFMLLIGLVGHARELLQTIPEVRRLSTEEAAAGLPVVIEAQVLRINERNFGFFAYDGETGTYVYTRDIAELVAAVEPGDIVRITGETTAGTFAPSIDCRDLKIVGREPLPKAREFQSREDLLTTGDCDWVLIKGMILSMAVLERSNAITLEVQKNESVLCVRVPYSIASERRLSELMSSRVAIPAVAGTVFNAQRQATDRVFFANSAETFEVLGKQGMLLAPTSVPIQDLMRFGFNLRRPVRTQGVVSYVGGGYVYLEDSGARLKASVPAEPELKVGDHVELEGFAWPQPVSPAFRARAFTVTAHGEPPTPVKVVPVPTTDPDLNYALIELDARLLEVGKSFALPSDEAEVQDQFTLLCRSNGELFEAKLPPGVEVGEEVMVGATLRLTGICHVIRSPRVKWRLEVDGFELELKAEDGIQVLVPPPWWTTTRLVWGLGIAVGLSGLFLVWVVMLRRRVEAQTAIISSKIERESTLDERQRIARELHDNLEQGLAGMAIQLRSCLKLLNRHASSSLESLRHSLSLTGDGNEALKEHIQQREGEIKDDLKRSRRSIEVLQDMLNYCSQESRSSILDLRGGVLETMDLVAAIRAALEPLFQESGVELSFSVLGEVRPLEKRIERNLLLITKEAASNALRHANAKQVGIIVEYDPKGIRIGIEDDGCGFDTRAAALAGRFGLQGMRERIDRIGGSIEIDSRIGQGTRIVAEVSPQE